MRRVIMAVVLSVSGGGLLFVGAASAPTPARAAAGDLGGITGTVVDPAGHAVAGVDVRAVVALSNVVAAHTTTDAAGTFTLTGLRSQNYDLRTAAAGYAAVNRNLDAASTIANGTPVAVRPGRTAAARIGLVRNGALTGTVTDAAHHGLAGVQVTAEMGTPGQASDPAFEYRTTTDSQGRYQINGMEPTVTSAGTHQGYQVSFFRNGLSILTVTQTVAPDVARVLNATLAAGGPVSLSGTVRNAAAQPVAGLAVTLSTEGLDVLSNGFGGFDIAGDHRCQRADGGGARCRRGRQAAGAEARRELRLYQRLSAVDLVGDNGRHLPDAGGERRIVLDRHPGVLPRSARRATDDELTGVG